MTKYNLLNLQQEADSFRATMIITLMYEYQNLILNAKYRHIISFLIQCVLLKRRVFGNTLWEASYDILVSSLRSKLFTGRRLERKKRANQCHGWIKRSSSMSNAKWSASRQRSTWWRCILHTTHPVARVSQRLPSQPQWSFASMTKAYLCGQSTNCPVLAQLRLKRTHGKLWWHRLRPRSRKRWLILPGTFWASLMFLG